MFLQKYGCLIDKVDVRRVGVNVAILFSISDMIRKLLGAAAFVFLTSRPYFVIFTFNFTTIFYIMFNLYYIPISNKIEHVRVLLNELTVLAVVYHMFCFTDFLVDYKTQNYIGSFLVYLVIFNGCMNVTISLIDPVQRSILWLKRLCHRYFLAKKAVPRSLNSK